MLYNVPPLQGSWDVEILNRSGSVPVGKGQAGYVLLAAASRNQVAEEWRIWKEGEVVQAGGYFTTVLLDVLAEEDINQLTYKALMHKISFDR